VNRRTLLKMTGAAALLSRAGLAADCARQANLPAEVAGVTRPRSRLALAAAGFAQHNCPDFLFNGERAIRILKQYFARTSHRRETGGEKTARALINCERVAAGNICRRSHRAVLRSIAESDLKQDSLEGPG
jgi:hypothetical protein